MVDWRYFLSEHDWESLCDGAQRISWQKDDIVIAQGSDNSTLFILISGRLRVERHEMSDDGEFQKVWIGGLVAEDVVGEVSFLSNKPASASVIADSDDVEVIAIDFESVRRSVSKDSGLSSRFYSFLAAVLADRLCIANQQLGAATIRNSTDMNQSRLNNTKDLSYSKALESSEMETHHSDGINRNYTSTITEKFPPSGLKRSGYVYREKLNARLTELIENCSKKLESVTSYQLRTLDQIISSTRPAIAMPLFEAICIVLRESPPTTWHEMHSLLSRPTFVNDLEQCRPDSLLSADIMRLRKLVRVIGTSDYRELRPVSLLRVWLESFLFAVDYYFEHARMISGDVQ